MENEITTYTFKLADNEIETFTAKKFVNNSDKTKWVMAHNGVDIYHPSTIPVNSTIDTAQPFLEIFDSKEEAKVAFPNIEWPLTLDEMENMKDNIALQMNQAIS